MTYPMRGTGYTDEDRTAIVVLGCLKDVFPETGHPMPKRKIFRAVSHKWSTIPGAPHHAKRMSYLRREWPNLRCMMSMQCGIDPTYVDGGGYQVGNDASVRKQLEHDPKITKGVNATCNAYALAIVTKHPKVPANKWTLVARRLTALRLLTHGK